MTDRSMGLLAWQWSSYGEVHRTRANLTLHALTNPLFLAGVLAIVAAPFAGGAYAAAGAVAMALAMALQGRGHRTEATPPKPFAGPFDVVARIFVEQLVTFPRYVLTGGFARAWRQTANQPNG